MSATPDNSAPENRPALTLTDLRRMKAEGEKIACLTAYESSFMKLEDRAGVDVVLVGDSLGMVVQGLDTTVPVTMDDMVYHARATARGTQRAFLMVDMPFMSYATPEQALDNAVRLMQEGSARMVKLEGGETQAEIVAFLTERGIPVCAHIGLTPQHVHKLGGFRVQGREDASAQQMLRDARALEDAGADVLLIECVPSALGAEVTKQSQVPVIGIGAGPDVDGQILVMHDMLGVTLGRKPKFVQDFLSHPANESGDIQGAMAAYVRAVKEGSYPDEAHSFDIPVNLS